MAAGSLHISISAEQVTQFFGVPISNSIITSLVVSGIIVLLALIFKATYKPEKPAGFANMVEAIMEVFYNMIQGVTQSKKKTLKFFPLIVTFFLFITLNNWFGLLPGVGTIGFLHEEPESKETASFQIIPEAQAVDSIPAEHVEEEQSLDHDVDLVPVEEGTHEVSGSVEEGSTEHHSTFVPLFRAGTADLNTTLALAIFTQVFAQIFGFSYVGFGYLKKFFNFSSPIMMFVGILEFLGEFTKVISFAFRLFGNVFAGEVLLAVMLYLSSSVIPSPVSYVTGAVVPMPFYGLELFVGVVQGLVFAMLSLVFFNMATISHEEH